MDGDIATAPGRWVLTVDASWWPIAAGDQIVDWGEGEWTVVEAKLLRRDFDATVDYVRVEAALGG